MCPSPLLLSPLGRGRVRGRQGEGAMDSQVDAAPPTPESRLWRWGKWAIPLSVVPLLILLA